jgi:hypothetical protein
MGYTQQFMNNRMQPKQTWKNPHVMLLEII